MIKIYIVTIIVLLVVAMTTNADSGECSRFKTNEFISSNSGLSPYDHLNAAAYLFQSCNIVKKNKKIVGYKAGITSEISQARFNTKLPVFGVLSEGQQLKSNVIVKGENNLIETEMAFRIKTSINSLDFEKKSISELLDGVAPAIEIPNLKLDKNTNVNVSNIIAANVGSYKYILGKFVSIKDFEMNKKKVTLYKDDKIIDEQWSNAPLGDQKAAIKWVITKALLEGYDLKKGDLILSGAITMPMPLSTGIYEAKFEDMETVRLEVYE